MQRRSLLKLGAAATVVLVLAGGTAALVQPGLRDGRLTDAARAVFAALGNALLDGSLPTPGPDEQFARPDPRRFEARLESAWWPARRAAGAAGLRRGHRRHRRRRRHHGRDAGQRRPEGGAGRRRPAAQQRRLPPARGGRLPALYQESAARKTADKAINILQGRCVGGSTTVNWTSLPHAGRPRWRSGSEHFGLADFTPKALAPWFEQAEQRLNIGPWLRRRPTPTTSCCARGAARWASRPQPSAQRQGLLEPRLLRHGLPHQRQAVDAGDHPSGGAGRGRHLLVQTRAERLLNLAGRPRAGAGGACRWRHGALVKASRARRARHYVLAAGAINSPGAAAALGPARSRTACSGRRTFLHPVVLSARMLRRAHRGLAGRAADHLHRPLPGDAAHRRPHRLQARGAAAAPGDLCLAVHGGLRPGAGRLLRAVVQHPGAAGAAARRLPRQSPGAGAAARRRHARARLPAHAPS
jgi:hypothetical protein